MNDQAAWEKALTAARCIHTGLKPPVSAEFNILVDAIIEIKKQLVEHAAAAGSSQICRECRGECCRHGKYHVSILDILAYLRCGAEPVTPDFSTHPECPYANSAGCTMPPGFRPMTCVVFNCELVEEKFTAAERATFKVLEQKLRQTIRTAEQLTALRLSRPLLLSITD